MVAAAGIQPCVVLGVDLAVRVCVDVTSHFDFVPCVSTLKMCVTDTYIHNDLMSILAKFSRLRRATRARYARWGNLTTLAVTIIPVSTYIGVETQGNPRSVL
jgi:hypothetical protein